MAVDSKIEWTDTTWNPVTGCTRVSSGCDHCYAFTMTKRLAAMGHEKYQGLVGNGHFNGVVKTWPDTLVEPLYWRKPRRVFVNSMSDLFHERVPFEFIDQVFAIMHVTGYQLPLPPLGAPIKDWHTYQILTKRPDRMAEYFEARKPSRDGTLHPVMVAARKLMKGHGSELMNAAAVLVWPLWNVWIGTSIEDQQTADERIPHLLRCPAAVRFLSAEPLLGPIDLDSEDPDGCHAFGCGGGESCSCGRERGVGWLIAGGESGPGARPCDVAWIRSIVGQCKAAVVPCFVKQLGQKIQVANDSCSEWPDEGDGWIFDPDQHGWSIQGEPVIISTPDRKGCDPAEWPADLRVREFPASEATA